jgi:hypothetical protein
VKFQGVTHRRQINAVDRGRRERHASD